MANATEVMPRVYMSSLFVAANRDTVKFTLQITHMVNASNAPDPFPGEFEYLSMALQGDDDCVFVFVVFVTLAVVLNLTSCVWADDVRQALTPTLPRFLDFVKKAVVDEKGCVLIFSDRGVSRSAALAIAWIMEELNTSFYESFIYLKVFLFLVWLLNYLRTVLLTAPLVGSSLHHCTKPRICAATHSMGPAKTH